MSSCQTFADAVLDETAPRPEGFAAHLAGCSECSALRQAHRGAQLLEGVTLTRTERVPVRRVVFRASALAAVLVIAGAGWIFSRPDAPVPVSVSVETRPAPGRTVAGTVTPQEPASELEQPPLRVTGAPVEEDDGSGLALAELSGTVGRYSRVNPVAHGYGPRWKSLPALLAPRGSQPLASLEKSFHPLVYTSEE